MKGLDDQIASGTRNAIDQDVHSTTSAMPSDPARHPPDSSSTCSGPESMGLRRERVFGLTKSAMLVLLTALAALFTGALLVFR